jgi:hypothetical protein
LASFGASAVEKAFLVRLGGERGAKPDLGHTERMEAVDGCIMEELGGATLACSGG